MTHPTIPDRVPAGATPEGDGVVVGPGPVRIDAFIDFLCPFCKRFELSSGPTLAGLVADGLASLVYHPMNFLDEASTTQYSTRAAASSGCAADSGRFLEYAHALFVNQPAEGGPGLTDAELAAIGRGVGLDTAFAACLSEGHYLDWPPYVTARAVAAGVGGTPTVLVDGVVVAPEPQVITAAVAQVARRLVRYEPSCRSRASKDRAISRRILGAISRSREPNPPCTSTLLTTRTRPVATGSITWSKTTLPMGTGHSLTQRRPSSTSVMVKEPPRLPRCFAQPETPGWNGPSSRAISLLTSHSGQRSTSVHTFQTSAGSAPNVASHSNRYIYPAFSKARPPIKS